MTPQYKLFYFASIATDEINRRYGTNYPVGAAANKVLGVCAALRSAGVCPVIVSPLISSTFGKMTLVENLRTNGTCYAKVFSLGRGVVKRLVSTFSLLLYAATCVKVGDTVLLYNYAPEFCLTALYLRMRGRPALLDIEDAPWKGQPGLWGIVNPIFFRIITKLCARRYVTASRSLAVTGGITDFIAVHGVATPPEVRLKKFSAPRVSILFGGSIARETGLDLFVEAVKLLSKSAPDLPADFFVTGSFPKLMLTKLQNHVHGHSRLRISTYDFLTAAEYEILADRMDIGLSLKLPSHDLGATTFPSKVIEYTARGLLLCGTRVSDVTDIFDDDSALLLAGESPAELAEALSEAILDRSRSARLAWNGQSRVLEIFSTERVGKQLAEFVYGRQITPLASTL